MATTALPNRHTTTIATVGWRRTFSALQNPEYRILWWGMVASWAAMQMKIVAWGYLAYDITGSATALGLVHLSSGFPMLLFSLFGGVIVDRVRKRQVLVWSQATMGLLALATAVLVHLGIIEVWHLIALGLCQGVVFSFNMPARQAIIPEIVGTENLTNAIALNNAGQNFSRILGPALAGGLIAIPFIGMTGTFYAMAVLYAVVVWSILRLPSGKMPRRIKGPMVSEIKSGLLHIGGSSVLTMLISMAFIPILLGMPFQTLMPVFQKDVLHVGSFGLGMLYTAVGVGALIGSLVIAALYDSRARGSLQAAAGLIWGVALIGFALTGSFVLALGMVAILGFASSAYMTLNSSMIMSYTNEEYYGRVMSVYMMTFGLMPLSSLPMAALTDAAGAPMTVAVAGLLVLSFVGAITFLVPAYRRIQ